MNLTDRLRSVLRPGEPASRDGIDGGVGGSAARNAPYVPPRGPQGSAGPHPQSSDALARTLGGEWQDNGGRRFLSVDARYAPGYRHGRVAVADCVPPDEGWPSIALLGSPVNAGPLLFVDVETTGLAGGAGTYPFLIGCGWFEQASFHVRQFFLASYGAEPALLEAVAAAASAAGGVVTYNGKTFDLPLLEMRFGFNRMATPFPGVPHVDMLHAARHLWRSDLADAPASCRLTTLEERLLGHIREDDVPGFEIPSRYFHYVRTNDARPLQAVLAHNRLDVLALAMLTARAAQLVEAGPGGAHTPREALGLGRLYERRGMKAQARASYARAAGLDESSGAFAGDARAPSRAEALRAYAVLCRRERDYHAAADAWQRALDLRWCPPRIAREASEALAVHHEHRARDLGAARLFARQALQFNLSTSAARAAAHRLARLDRRLGLLSGQVAR